MCCRFVGLCVRHIWPGPSGYDWFTSLLSSPSNTFQFGSGAAGSFSARAHTHTHIHTLTSLERKTHICSQTFGRRHTVHISDSGNALFWSSQLKRGRLVFKWLSLYYSLTSSSLSPFLSSSLLLFLPLSVAHQSVVDRGEILKQTRHKLFFRDSVGFDECDERERHFIDNLTCMCVCIWLNSIHTNVSVVLFEDKTHCT